MIPGALEAARIARAAPKLKELKKACDAVESGFLKQMLGAMHRMAESAKPLGDDTGMDAYQDMMDNAVADRLASRGAVGISKMAFHATARQALGERPAEPAPTPHDPKTRRP